MTNATPESVKRLTTLLFHERAAEAFDRANMLPEYMEGMEILNDTMRALEELCRKASVRKTLKLNQFKERNQFKW